MQNDNSKCKIMLKEDYLKIKEWMFRDVEREISLAKSSIGNEKEIINLGIVPGGGNYLAALGLMCYTELGGSIIRNKTGEGQSLCNFKKFFISMGKGYKTFWKDNDNGNENVYSVFRCGFVHSYAPKNHDTEIQMCSQDKPIGISKENKYLIINIEKYFEDFKTAFEKLINCF